MLLLEKTVEICRLRDSLRLRHCRGIIDKFLSLSRQTAISVIVGKDWDVRHYRGMLMSFCHCRGRLEISVVVWTFWSFPVTIGAGCKCAAIRAFVDGFLCEGTNAEHGDTNSVDETKNICRYSVISTFVVILGYRELAMSTLICLVWMVTNAPKNRYSCMSFLSMLGSLWNMCHHQAFIGTCHDRAFVWISTIVRAVLKIEVLIFVIIGAAWRYAPV